MVWAWILLGLFIALLLLIGANVVLSHVKKKRADKNKEDS